MTKITQRCAECQVNDDHFEFQQLHGICLRSGLIESTKYSDWDRETRLDQNNISLLYFWTQKDAKQSWLI